MNILTQSCLLWEMKAVKCCILSTYSISCWRFLSAHLLNYQVPAQWAWLSPLESLRQGGLRQGPSQDQDESWLHVASLLSSWALPGMLGSWAGSWPRSRAVAHAPLRRVWAHPPTGATASTHAGRFAVASCYFCDGHEAPQPSLETVTLEIPDPQAGLAQALPADPIRESGQVA